MQTLDIPMRMVGVVAIAAAACTASRTPSVPEAPPARLARIVAHRGASFDVPENTMAAFRRAWELGVEAVELDVRATRDDEVVIMHDPTTKRTAGVDRAVADQTLAELKALDAGAWKGTAFAGERIPTIGEVLASVPPGRTVFIEIKSPSSTAATIARAVLAADPRPRGARLALLGFDPAALVELARALPGVPAYQLAAAPRNEDGHPRAHSRELLTSARRRGLAGLALEHTGVDDEYLQAARAARLAVIVWTINEPLMLRAWQARDVRWIETDRPDLTPTR